MKTSSSEIFITATGLAALVHSTWSLGTLFAGVQPPAGFTVEFIGWLAPALLIAFALDVGQIATSAEIRKYGLTKTRGFTFAVFALATYYLQWLYIAHHMPALELAEGVRQSWSTLALLFRDSAIWIIPALLPASTLLYTFSGEHQPDQPQPAPAPVVAVAREQPQQLQPQQLQQPQPEQLPEPAPKKAPKRRAARTGITAPEADESGAMQMMQNGNGHIENVGRYEVKAGTDENR